MCLPARLEESIAETHSNGGRTTKWVHRSGAESFKSLPAGAMPVSEPGAQPATHSMQQPLCILQVSTGPHTHTAAEMRALTFVALSAASSMARRRSRAAPSSSPTAAAAGRQAQQHQWRQRGTPQPLLTRILAVAAAHPGGACPALAYLPVPAPGVCGNRRSAAPERWRRQSRQLQLQGAA